MPRHGTHLTAFLKLCGGRRETVAAFVIIVEVMVLVVMVALRMEVLWEEGFINENHVVMVMFGVSGADVSKSSMTSDGSDSGDGGISGGGSGGIVGKTFIKELHYLLYDICACCPKFTKLTEQKQEHSLPCMVQVVGYKRNISECL